MQLSDFYPEFKGWVPAKTADKSAPQIPDDRLQSSAYLRAPLPLPLQYAPDTLKQYYRPGLSSFRNAPQSPSSFPAINAAASGVANNTVSAATIAATPSSSSGGGVTSVGLTAPNIFVAPVSGSPVTTAGTLGLQLAPEPANTVWSAAQSQGNVALDGAAFATGTASPAIVSCSTSQANDFGLFAVTVSSTTITSSIGPAGWTQLNNIPGSGIGGGLWWTSGLPTNGVSASAAFTGTPTGGSAFPWAANLITLKANGTPSVRQVKTVTAPTGSFGTATLTFTSNLLAGSALLVVIQGAATGTTVAWSLSDTQGNQYSLLDSASIPANAGPTAPQAVQTFAAPSSSAGACTLTITNQGTNLGGNTIVYAIEVTSLALPNFLPLFTNLRPSQIPGMEKGFLDVAHGGTGASLSATGGGGNQVLVQGGVGSVISVRQLDFPDMSGAGRITNYQGIGTVSNGVPSEYATRDLVNQAAAIATTAIYTPTATGMFRISAYLKVTTVDATSSTLGAVTVTYTDGTDSVPQSAVMQMANESGASTTSNAGNTTAAKLIGSMTIWALTGVAIQYAIAYASNVAGTMKYEVHLKVEAL